MGSTRAPALHVALLVAVVATGCGALFGGAVGDTVTPTAPCECPNSERIVLEIDWMGESSVADERQSWGGGAPGEETPLLFVYFNDFPDALAAPEALDRLLDGLESGGLEVVQSSDSTWDVQLADSRVLVSAPFVVESAIASNVISIKVNVFVADSDAPAALQPLVDALGTIG